MDLKPRKFWLDHGGGDFQQQGEGLKLCLAVSARQRGEVFHLANKVYYYTAIMKPIKLCQRLLGRSLPITREDPQ